MCADGAAAQCAERFLYAAVGDSYGNQIPDGVVVGDGADGIVSGSPGLPQEHPAGTAPIAQLAEAADLKSAKCRFESDWGHGPAGS